MKTFSCLAQKLMESGLLLKACGEGGLNNLGQQRITAVHDPEGNVDAVWYSISYLSSHSSLGDWVVAAGPMAMLVASVPALLLRYLVTGLMDSDLHDILKYQTLNDDQIQFLLYQILRGLKVSPWSLESTRFFVCSDS